MAQVTYLFTDIEGSTRRWQDSPESMSLDLARHFDLLGVAVEAHGGTVVQDTGDGIFAAFPNARDAVASAVRAQRELTATTWGDGTGELRVRMGIHTGMADPGSRQYRGTSVNRCARVMDAAHGGQILLSEAAWSVVRDRPPDGVGFTDLGEHHLKDLRQPERLVQVTAPGLTADFPPPRSQRDDVVACPYRGLAAFQPEDADRFFGRDALVDQLVAHLASSDFLAVVGPSGSGKSSVVRAGLLPRLAAGGLPGSSGWATILLSPGQHPIDELAGHLGRLTGQGRTEVARLLRDDPRAVATAIDQCLAGRPSEARLLVVVDQFEELFTLCDDDGERRRFIEVVLATSAYARGLAVIALRADFYGRCADHADLADQVTRSQVLVGPMRPEELRAAIVEPAHASGLRVEPALVDAVLEAAGGEAAGLPLVSHAMVETWLRRDGSLLTLAGYRQAGGVEGAISRTAETVYRERFDRLEQAVARLVLLRLVEPTDHAEDTRRPAALAELRPADVPDELVDDVLDELVGARLVTVTESTAELAHEALIREWPTLREWLDEGRDALRLQRHLTDAAGAWEETGRDEAELYGGARLAGVRDLLDQGQLSPSALEREFIDASLQRQQRAEEEARQRARRLRLLLTATGAGLVVALVAGAVAVQQRQEARDQRAVAEQAAAEADRQRVRAEDAARTATARELAAAAMANLDVDPELSILLAVEAVEVTRRHDGSVLPDAETALHHAVQVTRVVARYPGSRGVALSPDGEGVVVTSDDGPVHVYDVATQEEVLVLRGHEGRPLNVDYSDDGRLIASSGFDDGTVRIWDAASGEQVASFEVGAPVLTPTFSPDGDLVAAPALDGFTHVWDLATAEERYAFEAVGGLAFSPAGDRLTVATEFAARSWALADGVEVASFEGGDETLDVSYSPDGRLLATGHERGFVVLWDVATGQQVDSYPVTSGSPADNVTFDRQGTRLAVTDRDGFVRVLDATTGQQQLVLPAPGASELHFSADGTRLVAGTTAGAALMWDVTPTGARDLAAFAVPEPFGLTVAFTPDGGTLALASADLDAFAGSVTRFPIDGGQPDTLRVGEGVPAVLYSDGDRLRVVVDVAGSAVVLDAFTGGEAVRLGHDLALADVAPSPDARLLVTAGFDLFGGAQLDPASAYVWDARSGAQIRQLGAHDLDVLDVAFSPDGRLLATGSQDETATVWDTATWEVVARLEGHADNVESVVFTPEGDRLVTASPDGTLRLWDVASGAALRTLSGHTAGVLWAGFDDDGRLWSAGSDNTVRAWDLERGVAVREVPIPRGASEFALSPDGRRLATLGFVESVAQVVTLDVGELVAVAADRATRGFTADECERYLGELASIGAATPTACRAT